MKRVMMVVMFVVAIGVLSGIVLAAVTTTWPTKTQGLVAKLASGENLCAIFTLGKGVIEVGCAKKVTGGYDNIRAYNCPTVGLDQVCAPVVGGTVKVTVKVSDTNAAKATKVCGPAGAVYVAYK